MSAHTPGPWESNRPWSTAASFPHYVRATLPCGNMVLVAAVYRQLGRKDLAGDDQETANARLIAAAPELLQAAQQAIYLLESNGIQHPSIDAVIRAAISKATGGAL